MPEDAAECTRMRANMRRERALQSLGCFSTAAIRVESREGRLRAQSAGCWGVHEGRLFDVKLSGPYLERPKTRARCS